MVQVGNLSAWVTIGADHVEAQEYDIKTEQSPALYGQEFNARLTTCWIESRVGETFAVNWKDTSDGPFCRKPIAGYIYLDGVSNGGTVMTTGASTTRTNTTSDVLISAYAAKPFMFSKLVLTDDETALDKPSVEHIGDIVIELWDVIHMGSMPALDFSSTLPGDEKVHERSKKGSAHRVKYGDAVARSSPTRARVEKLRLRNRITFKYRSIDLLRANGIAPAALPTVGETFDNDDEEEDNNDEEARRLETRLAVLNARRQPNAPVVKKEEGTSRGKILSLGVIDLTDDDDTIAGGKRKRDDQGQGDAVKKEKKPKIKLDPLVHGGFIDLT